MQPLDLFSGHASLYAQYRIDYPAELYDCILPVVARPNRAWDCATGNGQVAVVLANSFTEVEATDSSQQQLDQAIARPNIRYQVAPAEQTPFPDAHFDLITVAQALHWFNLAAFHQEVRRVAKPGAILAEWGYGLTQIDEAIDDLLTDFYRNRTGPYWHPNRRHIDTAYASLPFPFANARQATFTVRRHWSLERFLNYLRTWSAVQKYIHQNEIDPVTALGSQLIAIWGTGEREVQFPVFLRVGVVNG